MQKKQDNYNNEQKQLEQTWWGFFYLTYSCHQFMLEHKFNLFARYSNHHTFKEN